MQGSLRVTLPPSLATYLLAPDPARIARLHTEVEIDVITSNEPANLTNREADVAIRVVYDRDTLSPNLHGSKGLELLGGVSIARDLLAARRNDTADPVRWIVRDDHGIPDWARVDGVAVAQVPFRTNDAGGQIAAIHQGTRIATLSCFVGDADPRLVQVLGSALHLHGCLRALSQGEARKTKRVRLFVEFIGRSLVSHAAVLAGQCPELDRDDVESL